MKNNRPQREKRNRADTVASDVLSSLTRYHANLEADTRRHEANGDTQLALKTARDAATIRDRIRAVADWKFDRRPVGVLTNRHARLS